MRRCLSIYILLWYLYFMNFFNPLIVKATAKRIMQMINSKIVEYKTVMCMYRGVYEIYKPSGP